MNFLHSPHGRQWLAIGLALVSIVFWSVGSLQSQGQPTVTWSEADLVEFLLPSSSRKVTVTFRSTNNLTDASVTVTPSLASLVTVSPTTFKRIQANRDQRLTIEIKAPQQSQLTFDGTIHLRGANQATIAAPLSLSVVVHNEPVPPDPGEAGKATLEGIDSDGDGVRDDVQRYIVVNYLTSARSRSAQFQYAKALQETLLNASDEPAAKEAFARMSTARDCLEYLFVAAGLQGSLASDVKVIVLNTVPRIQAYAAAEQLGAGSSSLNGNDDSLRNGCDFDPDNLPN